MLAPTRELANQINDVLMPLAHTFGMNTTTVYGGVKYIHQIRDLKAGADIVVACPGRLEDLLRQQALTLSSVDAITRTGDATPSCTIPRCTRSIRPPPNPT